MAQMRRKVIRQGNNSYTLTLPKRWIESNSLQEGEEVEVDDSGPRLYVTAPTNGKKMLSTTTFDLNGYNDRTIKNILYQSYRKGYDKIIMKIHDDSQKDAIKETVRETMLGFDVTEEKDNLCIVENIAEPSSDKYEVILRKIFLIIKQQSEETLEELRSGNISKMSKIEDQRKIVDNYTNFARRVIIKDKIGGPKNSYMIYYSVTFLSIIYHAYYYLYKDMSKHKKGKISKDSLIMLKNAADIFNDYYHAFYKKDISLANEIGLKRDKILREDLYAMLRKSKGIDNVVIYHAGEIIRLTGMAAIVIFGLIPEKTEEFL